MEGDKAVLYRIHDGILSTHALRMEGDAITIALNQIFSLSTHALTWRATMARRNAQKTTRYFYPRPRVEGDGEARQTIAGTVPISIHALA